MPELNEAAIIAMLIGAVTTTQGTFGLLGIRLQLVSPTPTNRKTCREHLLFGIALLAAGIMTLSLKQ